MCTIEYIGWDGHISYLIWRAIGFQQECMLKQTMVYIYKDAECSTTRQVKLMERNGAKTTGHVKETDEIIGV